MFTSRRRDVLIELAIPASSGVYKLLITYCIGNTYSYYPCVTVDRSITSLVEWLILV
ncbi:hypothetical protein KUL152_32540 [Tenacibaculum sp. KUL152]|nr:hypothetical protein KUL152_32540 [Tenacibaculum sp. KUL152]